MLRKTGKAEFKKEEPAQSQKDPAYWREYTGISN